MPSEGHSSSAAVLSDVVKALGPSVAHLVGGSACASQEVSTLVLHDPLSDVRAVAGGFLLAIGVRPAGNDWQDLMKAAAAHGYVCVAVKPSGVTRQDLVDSADESDVAVIALADEIAWEQIVTLTSSAMRHSYSAEPALGNTRLGDLFALANAVAISVGGATAIVDSRQSIIAYSTVEGQPIDETRRKSILGLRVPSRPATDSEYREVHGATGVVAMPSTNADFPRLAVPIRAGGELLGSVWVIDESGSASKAAKVELQHAADIAALHLLQARAEAEVSDRRRGDMLAAVFDDGSMSAEASAALGIAVSDHVRVAAIGIADVGVSGEAVTACHQTLELAIQHCSAELGFSAATVSSGLVFLLLPVAAGDSDRTSLTRLLNGIDVHARRSYGYRLVIGVGEAVPGLGHAHASMAQALQVVRLMRRDFDTVGALDDDPLVAFAEMFTSRLALLALAEHVGELDEAANSTILAMIEHDRANASDYVPTVKAFFQAHGNISEMAHLLHVHANTCRYRMSRVASLFDVDLEDQDSRLLLWLQLRLHELRD